MAARKPAKKAATKQAVKRPAPKKAAKKPAKKAVRKAAKRAAPARRPDGSRKDKGEGKAAIDAAIRKLPAPHRAMAELFDAIVTREVPNAARAVKWGAPMWGVPGRGWFAGFGSFKSYAKINFFSGAQLDPAPPEGDGKDMRSVNIPSMAEFDEARITSWVRQASSIPGWGKA